MQDQSKLKFAPDPGFQADVRRAVDAHFARTGQSPRANAAMFVKTLVILGWFVASYVALVFVATSALAAVAAAVSLALAVSGIGFSIQHDANHGAYSDHRVVNRILGFTLDVVGASSYLWSWKHNVFHHTYANVEGADEDIDVSPFGRVSANQPRYRMHRFQHFYMWVLYGFLVVKWQIFDDFKCLLRGRIAENNFPRPTRGRLVELVCGKVFFFGWALVLPLFFHPVAKVVAFYLGTGFIVGLLLAVVFQLAHCVDEAEFPQPTGERLPTSFATHQLATTIDFARRSRVLTWYLGGLNFQIEHHLFPKICHVHYPAIAPIVAQVAEAHGLRYRAHDGLGEALASHVRLLRRMGSAPVGVPLAQVASVPPAASMSSVPPGGAASAPG